MFLDLESINNTRNLLNTVKLSDEKVKTPTNIDSQSDNSVEELKVEDSPKT